jgi:hypothetical protein
MLYPQLLILTRFYGYKFIIKKPIVKRLWALNFNRLNYFLREVVFLATSPSSYNSTVDAFTAAY